MNIYKDKEKFNNYRKQCKSAKEDTFSTYILYSSFYHLFKIGKSGNVEKRLKAFQKVIPDIVLIIEINVDVEVALLCVFKHKNKCKKVCNVDIVAYLYFIFETNQIFKTCKNENNS